MSYRSFLRVAFLGVCMSLLCAVSPSMAATATLEKVVSSSGHWIDEAVIVDITAQNSTWVSVVFHCDKLGGDAHSQSFNVGQSGVGEHRYPAVDDPMIEFSSLESGNYNLYAVATGTTYSGGFQPWSASTGGETVTI